MNTMILTGAGLAIVTFLSGCGGTTTLGGVPLIAIPHDRGIIDSKNNTLVDGQAGIAYDPDGCQVFVIDDGVEGYSGRRFDPVSGLPVCNGAYPPGTVIGQYKTNNVPELLPGQQAY